MRKEYALEAAIEFGIKIWPYKEELKIEDIMLFGSVALGKENPRDLDMLLLHSNRLFDEFQSTAKSKCIEDKEKLRILAEKMKEKVDLLAILRETKIMSLIDSNLFNLNYMCVDFFRNESYRKTWKEQDLAAHQEAVPKEREKGEEFEDAMFRQGLLWNAKTSAYDIPAR